MTGVPNVTSVLKSANSPCSRQTSKRHEYLCYNANYNGNYAN